MSGYGYTGFFGPNDNIKRGDVAVVLYKMAGPARVRRRGRVRREHRLQDRVRRRRRQDVLRRGHPVGQAGGHRLRRHRHPASSAPEDTISRQELAKMLAVYARSAARTCPPTSTRCLASRGRGHRLRVGRGLRRLPRRGRVMGNNSPACAAPTPITRAEVATMVVRLSETRRLRQRDVQVIPRHGLRSHAKGRLPGRGASLLLSAMSRSAYGCAMMRLTPRKRLGLEADGDGGDRAALGCSGWPRARRCRRRRCRSRRPRPWRSWPSRRPGRRPCRRPARRRRP